MKSSAALSILLKDLKAIQRNGNYRTLRAYMASPAYRKLKACLDVEAEFRLMEGTGRLREALLPQAPLPPRWSMRARWTPERIEALRKADAKYGNDAAIARELGIPFKNIERARLRYVGPRRTRVSADAR